MQSDKKTYVKPQLIQHGSVEQITASRVGKGAKDSPLGSLM